LKHQKKYQAIEGRERLIPIEGTSKRTQSRSSSYSPRDRERNDSGRGSLHESGQQSRNDYYRNESRQSNYNNDHRYGGAAATTTLNDRPYTPKLSSPIINPANTNGYHRNETSSRVQDQTGYRQEKYREEYRSESRNGGIYQPRSTSVFAPREGLDNWRSESRGGAREGDYRTDSRHDYRVESPASNFGTNRRNGATAAATTSAANNEEQNRSESRAESVRSVRILRKTFE
jgi:hypothetical protein